MGNIDPTSPEMMAEFEKLKGVSMDEIKNELEMLGIPCSPDMDEMSVKLRLMEARIIFATPDATGPPPGKRPRRPRASREERVRWWWWLPCARPDSRKYAVV